MVSQFVIPTRRSLGGALPYVFTQEGVSMLSSVLRSERAVQVNITIMRAFVRMHSILSEHKELRKKVSELEQKYDHQFKAVFDAIQELMEPPAAASRKQIPCCLG